MRPAQNIKKNAGVIQRQRSSLSYLVVSDTRLRLPAGGKEGYSDLHTLRHGDCIPPLFYTTASTSFFPSTVLRAKPIFFSLLKQ